ncbi:CsbD family protein [Actinomycetospora straminea]|uniref:CsbD family protein n=1 Tax=Actinomycetospora straminea TaxID=663607 RepID=A0ABP9ELF8_9PSEU|nr:CsbD family protein [Actinomycetospora straminea]MDD7935001.1 CsbD family protein [Actinomycetospora straminea]
MPEDTSAEDLKGRAKEAVGAITGQDDWAREGQEQQKKADAEDTARQKEAEAQKARAEADEKEADQRKQQ